MGISVLPGRCLISFDVDEDFLILSKFGPGVVVHLPDSARRKVRTAFVHLHQATTSWDEISLTGRRVVVDRWSSRPFRLVKDGKEYTFYVISQWHVLGVIEEETL